uniref:DUF4219 domain-containing protein n=1 Tax=Amphimedon queenslandica TaxID=400682 RepID=A0A1X7TBJ6_AMPQE
MAESRSLITPLSGTNYPTWKVQCKMSLMKDGVWQIVTGKERIVGEGQDGYSKYVTHRDKALATIVLSVDPLLLYLVCDPTDPAVVWETILTQFQRKTWANKMALR